MSGLEELERVEKIGTIFSNSSGNNQTAQEKFENGLTGIVYSTLAVRDEQ